MDKFGIGVIGCGSMGRSLAHSAAALEHVDVLRVSDLVEERAKKLAVEVDAEYNLDYHKLLEDNRIQGVLIATPPFMHRRATVDAANAGKHIFCEKPMAPTLEDCEAMIEAAEQNEVKLAIGLVCRFQATHSKVRELVHSGDLGHVEFPFAPRGRSAAGVANHSLGVPLNSGPVRRHGRQ